MWGPVNFGFAKRSYTNILISGANMHARATKKSEATVRSVTARHRRSGRPRAATAAAKIYTDLRTELVSLRRRPGEVISEANIALSYGVSRTPVREAILKLADEGLVEIFPQSGIFVSRIPIAALPEAIIVRKALEETTSSMAAERATSSQILDSAFDPGTATRGKRRRRQRHLPSRGRAIPCDNRGSRRISGNLDADPAGKGARRSLPPADAAAAGTDPACDRGA